MKVNIGKYTEWFGPFQLAKSLCFWVKDVKDEYGFYSKPDWVHNFGDFLAHGFSPDESHKPKNERIHKERPVTWLYNFLLWIDSKKSRRVKIHIDRWDTWNLYNTLALIILPLLKQFKENLHGYPNVDINDIPEEIKLSNKDSEENCWEKEMVYWIWILDEMIWTFEQLQPDYNWEEQYYSGECDIYFEAVEPDENGKSTLHQLNNGPNHTFTFDEDAIKKHQERINNGLRLFGKYFQTLWQ